MCSFHFWVSYSHTHTSLQLARTVCLMRCSIVTRPNRTVTVCYSSAIWGLPELPHSLNTLLCCQLQGVKSPSRRRTHADAFSLQLLALLCIQNKDIPSWSVRIIILVQLREPTRLGRLLTLLANSFTQFNFFLLEISVEDKHLFSTCMLPLQRTVPRLLEWHLLSKDLLSCSILLWGI